MIWSLSTSIRWMPVFLLGITTLGCGNPQAPNYPGADIEPMAVGNTWEYQSVEIDGSKSTLKRVITSATSIDGEVQFHYTIYTPRHNPLLPNAGYDQLVRKDAIYIVFPNERPTKIVPLNPKAGETWENKLENATDKYKVESIDESVTTPAGKFKCVVVLNEMEDRKGKHFVRFYFARGVGLVRTIYDDGVEELLVKYKVVK